MHEAMQLLPQVLRMIGECLDKTCACNESINMEMAGTGECHQTGGSPHWGFKTCMCTGTVVTNQTTYLQ